MTTKESDRFYAQIERIRNKLAAARKSDWRRRAFGSWKHRYRLGPAISDDALKALEEKYGLELPIEFRVFVTNIGNGGPGPGNSGNVGAGPYYGIQSAESILKSADIDDVPVIVSAMSDQAWDDIKHSFEEAGAASWELARGCAYLAHQGCSFWCLLVLKGPDRGRVVYFDEEGAKPRFTFENNFMDWYERWLDEVIAGYLRVKNPPWFGMTMAGDDKELLSVFASARDRDLKRNALIGLFKLPSVGAASIARLSEIALNEAGALGQLAVEALLKFKPKATRPFLENLVKDAETDIESLCFSFDKSSYYLVPEIESELIDRLQDNDDHDTFFAIVSLLRKGGRNFGAALASLFDHVDAEFRKTIIWALGGARKREDLVDIFVAALRDPSAGVVRQALQSTERMNHPVLLAEFPAIAERCRKEPDWDCDGYVLANLRHRYRETRGLAGVLCRWYSWQGQWRKVLVD